MQWSSIYTPDGYGGSVAILDHAMVFNAPAWGSVGQIAAVRSMQRLSSSEEAMLDGDFTVTILFNSFSTGDGFGGLHIHIPIDSGDLYARITGEGIEADFISNDESSSVASKKSVAATMGTIRFTRSGGVILASVFANGTSVTAGSAKTNGPVRLLVDALGPSTGNPTTIHIKSIEVTDSSGTFQSDTFECAGAISSTLFQAAE